LARFSSSLPTRTVEEGARLIALAYLDDAAEALARLDDPEDTEALHDFRVAIRRSRSTLRAYRPFLRGSRPRRLGRKLRGLQQATNAGRDAEVQLEWLRGKWGDMAANQRHGHRWLTARVEARKGRAYQRAAEQVTKTFSKVAAEVRSRLREYRAEVKNDASAPYLTLAGAAAELIREHAGSMHDLLASIRSPEDETQAHQARISGKQLRYLLEPLAGPADLKPIVRRLKGLQDILGELHDHQVLSENLADALEVAAAEHARHLHGIVVSDEEEARDQIRRARRRDERAGLLALARLSADERRRCFATLERNWLGEPLEVFFRDVCAAADALERKGGGLFEIERKYLLSAIPERARAATCIEVDQGWLPGTTLRERVRRTRNANGEHYYRTVKLGAGVQRTELEEETTAEMFASLWPLTEGRRVRKHRYKVPQDDLVWEVDVFLDRDLVLAEVELPTADHSVEPPEWLAPLIVREVTDEPAYLNINLAG
jgi:CHAD domain-containing protein/CYTH domain-containing protein